MNAICDRAIGALRRELPDRMLILSERHLALVLRESLNHYNGHRPHQSPAPTAAGHCNAVRPRRDRTQWPAIHPPKARRRRRDERRPPRRLIAAQPTKLDIRAAHLAMVALAALIMQQSPAHITKPYFRADTVLMVRFFPDESVPSGALSSKAPTRTKTTYGTAAQPSAVTCSILEAWTAASTAAAKGRE